jgi:integrase
MKFKYSKSGFIYVGVKPAHGRIRWKTTKTKNMEDAKRMAREGGLIVLEKAAQSAGITSDLVTRLSGQKKCLVSAAVDVFLDRLHLRGRSDQTIASYRKVLLAWIEKAGLQDAMTTSVDGRHFRAFFNPGDGTKLGTLRNRKAACSSFCSFCIGVGLMLTNHSDSAGIVTSQLSQSEKLTKHHEPWTDAEAHHILQACTLHPFWGYAVHISWYMGMRLGDICQLEKDNLDGDTLRCRTSKTGAVVELKISEDLKKVFAAVMENGTPYLFPYYRALYLSPGGPARISAEFSSLCRKNGIAGKTFHGLRTTYIQSRVKLKMEEMAAKREVAAEVGHASTRTTDIYLSANPTNIPNEQHAQSKDHAGHPGGGHEMAGKEHAQPTHPPASGGLLCAGDEAGGMEAHS